MRLPAGTGIDFNSGGVVVFLLSSKVEIFINIENPLQQPAYRFPKQYGPRSPSFACGTLHLLSIKAKIYIPETASIRSHETVGMTREEQLDITFENIKELVKNGKLEIEKLRYKKVSYNYDSIKIYVLHLSDANYVTSHARNFFNLEKNNSPILISDICRSNLLLEIGDIYDYEFR